MVRSIRFTLYIAGDTPRSRAAEANLRRLCEERLPDGCTVDVVDVTLEAARAEAARILTTPTLVKDAPIPPRRVTGDLTDAQRLWQLLGLDDTPFPHSAR